MHLTYKGETYISDIILDKIQTLDSGFSSDFVWGTVF